MRALRQELGKLFPEFCRCWRSRSRRGGCCMRIIRKWRGFRICSVGDEAGQSLLAQFATLQDPYVSLLRLSSQLSKDHASMFDKVVVM
jgi:hypothetical protein